MSRPTHTPTLTSLTPPTQEVQPTRVEGAQSPQVEHMEQRSRQAWARLRGWGERGLGVLRERWLMVWMVALWGALIASLLSPNDEGDGVSGGELRVEGYIEGGRRLMSTRDGLEAGILRDPSGVILLTAQEAPRTSADLCVAALVRPRLALLSAECAGRVALKGVMWGGRARAQREVRVVSVRAHESGFALALLSAPVFAPPLRPTSPAWAPPQAARVGVGREGARGAGASAPDAPAERAPAERAPGPLAEEALSESALITLSTFALRSRGGTPHRRALTVSRRDGQRAAQAALGADEGVASEAALTGGRGDLLGFMSAHSTLLLTPEVTGWARELGERLTAELDALASAR